MTANKNFIKETIFFVILFLLVCPMRVHAESASCISEMPTAIQQENQNSYSWPTEGDVLVYAHNAI
jgi:hypothetical protein